MNNTDAILFSALIVRSCILTDDNPEILDNIAVLRIDDCGEKVEKVSEVTSSHVKLSESDFSLKCVLMKVGFPVEIHCSVLIYTTNAAFPTLHVYLIPCDLALQQVISYLTITKTYKYNTRTTRHHR